MCTAVVFAASQTDPEETCPNDPEPGEDFCSQHLALLDGPDPDAAYDAMREEALWA